MRMAICCSPSYVLNAFRHQRGSHRANGHLLLTLLCAQRLSASKRVAQSCPANRLRRHGCSTPFGIKEGRTQKTEGELIASSYKCSTPFGIKEGRTVQPPQKARRRVGVLNAFRHQRRAHSGRVNFASSSCCSPVKAAQFGEVAFYQER